MHESGGTGRICHRSAITEADQQPVYELAGVVTNSRFVRATDVDSSYLSNEGHRSNERVNGPTDER